MSVIPFRKLVEKELEAVDNLILERANEKSGLAHSILKYLLSNGGKRIRPLLLLLTSKACGYDGTHDITAAAVIECFHTATLLHDDVVDASTLRRGKKTVNAEWGNNTSILVGDFLYTLTVKLTEEIKAPAVTELLATVAHEVTSGELKQLSSKHHTNPSFEDYLEVIRTKTAVLFAAACATPPALMNDNHPLKDTLFNYGLHLGNTFQLIDDTLDYCTDAAATGKNAGDDLADGKATLPLIHVLEHGTDIQKKLVANGLKQGSLENFDAILTAIEETGAIEYTRSIAKHEQNLAIQALAPLPDSNYKTALVDLAHFALERNH